MKKKNTNLGQRFCKTQHLLAIKILNKLGLERNAFNIRMLCLKTTTKQNKKLQ